tara:strand:- start:26 stop:625 length:600 start_codon:yes stop_codon:yes gene_type:complete
MSYLRYTDTESGNSNLGTTGFHQLDDSVIHKANASPPIATNFQQVITFSGGILLYYEGPDAVDAGYVTGDQMIITESTVPAYNGNWPIATVGTNFAIVTGPTFSTSATGVASYDNVNVPDGSTKYYPDLKQWNRIVILQDASAHVSSSGIRLTTIRGDSQVISNDGVLTSWVINLLGSTIAGPFNIIEPEGSSLIAYKG